MSALSRLEGLIKDVVERPVWLLSANRIHPLELAQALLAEMEKNILPLDGERTAPDLYEAHLHPDNAGHFGEARGRLEVELASYLEEQAASQKLRFAAAPVVKIRSSAAVRPGEVAAYSRFAEVLRDSTVENVSGQTQAISLEEVRRLARTAARLSVETAGPHKGKSFALAHSPFRVGRSPDNDAQVEDLRLSRNHAEFRFDDHGNFWIKDLGSTNGTFVNEQRIDQEQPLGRRDRISLGGVEFKLVTA